MDVQQSLNQFRDWAFDLSGASQKMMWAAVAILVGYLLGFIVSKVLIFTGRRLAGLAHRHKANAAKGGTVPPSADSVVLDLLGSVMKLAGLLVGVGGAAWVFGFPLEKLETWAISGLIGLAVLVAAWFLGAWLGTRVRSFGDKISRHSGSSGRTLFAFLSSLARFGALAVGLIAALQIFGFPIASLVAVIGAAGLAIALALQDTLKAVAAGVIIAVFRPYRIGDYVNVAGQEGTVADITPFTTTLNTIDNREITVTNDKCWGNVIVNFSAHAMRRIDLVYSIDYDDDIDQALALLKQIFADDPRVRKEPPVWANVDALAVSSVNLRIRAWCAAKDMQDLNGDLLKKVKQTFGREGLSVPYPHQVHVEKYSAPATPEQGADQDQKQAAPPADGAHADKSG
jgi:small-conductance mechanosensitive channel